VCEKKSKAKQKNPKSFVVVCINTSNGQQQAAAAAGGEGRQYIADARVDNYLQFISFVKRCMSNVA
jgi:hypothetical protein